MTIKLPDHSQDYSAHNHQIETLTLEETGCFLEQSDHLHRPIQTCTY